MDKNQTEDVQIAVIANDIKYIKSEVKEINEKLSKEYVTKLEFDPVKRIVYGIISLILMGVFGALIGLVIK